MTTEKTIYHVFADNYDEYYATLEEAEKDFERLKAEKLDCRIYEQTETYEDGVPTGDIQDGDCLASYGEFPM